jgi:hypothetical protein
LLTAQINPIGINVLIARFTTAGGFRQIMTWTLFAAKLKL